MKNEQKKPKTKKSIFVGYGEPLGIQHYNFYYLHIRETLAKKFIIMHRMS